MDLTTMHYAAMIILIWVAYFSKEGAHDEKSKNFWEGIMVAGLIALSFLIFFNLT